MIAILKSATNFTHVKKQKKNKINKLSAEYYEYMQRHQVVSAIIRAPFETNSSFFDLAAVSMGSAKLSG